MITKVNKSIIIFCIFAFGFLLSNLVRSITATLTPVLTYEFDLTAGNLGLLAGGYFIGFSIMQVPIGLLLDKFGPKKVVGYFLIIALVGTISFALAKSFSGLLVSRIFIGIGVSACMMGPLTGYRVWFAEKYQQRANSWMLMVANIGFVSSTLPVQILLPYIGWRWIFILIAIEISYFTWSFLSYKTNLSDWIVAIPQRKDFIPILHMIIFYFFIIFYYLILT